MQLKWPMRWDLFSLFPAYAGVILDDAFIDFYYFSFPRIRGGDPVVRIVWSLLNRFSPHTRG